MSSGRRRRESFLTSFYRLYPLIGTENGDDTYDHLCGDPWGEETRKGEIALLRRHSRNRDPVFRAFLRDRERLLRPEVHSVKVLDVQHNFCESVADVFANSQPLGTREEVSRAMSRSRDIPRALRSFFLAVERSASLSGKQVVSHFLDTLRDLMSSLPYESRLYSFPELRSSLRSNFERPVLSFLSGRERILSLCSPSLSHHGICHGRRKGVYSSLLGHNVTLRSPDPDSIFRIGTEEVSRLRSILHRLGPPPPLRVLRRGDVLSAYKEVGSSVREEDLTSLFGSLRPSSSVVITTAPPSLEKSVPLAYYSGSVSPSPGTDSRPGAFLLNLSLPHTTRGVDSLFFHEAVPGHHFQLQIQDDMELPLYRSLCNHCAFEEGWAVYAESLLPPPSGAEGRRGVVESELFRACRLVLDVGIHCYGWMRGRAEEYLRRTCPFLPEKEVRSEILRYMCCPGQACCYTVGLLSIRHYVWRERGKGRTLPSIHSSLLKGGSVPLSSLLDTREEKELFS